MNQETAAWVERSARLGYAAKGIVYITVGILATLAAFNQGGETTSSNGALYAIAAQPFGQILLAIVAVGLSGYVLWRFIQTIQDPEHQNRTKAKDLFRRLGYAINGLVYGSIAFTAIQILAKAEQSQQANNDNSTQLWTARIMAQPFGQWLVGAAGAVMIGVACYYFYQAWTTQFRKCLNLQAMSQRERTWAIRLGQLGIAARAVVFLIIGGFLIQAAHKADPSAVRSSEGALQTLQHDAPFGSVWLGVVALGLVAYGIHLGIQARYRRIDPA